MISSPPYFSAQRSGEPYGPEVKSGDWKQILALEAEWKKTKGYT